MHSICRCSASWHIIRPLSGSRNNLLDMFHCRNLMNIKAAASDTNSFSKRSLFGSYCWPGCCCCIASSSSSVLLRIVIAFQFPRSGQTMPANDEIYELCTSKVSSEEEDEEDKYRETEKRGERNGRSRPANIVFQGKPTTQWILFLSIYRYHVGCKRWNKEAEEEKHPKLTKRPFQLIGIHRIRLQQKIIGPCYVRK